MVQQKKLIMKKLFFLYFIFSFFLSNSQSIDVLERNNGYKSLKINSYKWEYEINNNLEFTENKNGYTTYKYVDGFEIVKESIHIKKKTNIAQLANLYGTSTKHIKSLNPNLKMKRDKIKKNQNLIVPKRKKTNPIDKSLFNLFGEKVNAIYLTFENNSHKLKKISLNLDKTKRPNWLTVLGYNLKELYTEFENLFGQTTEYPKPTSDCYKFKDKSCLYFENKIFKGKILWKSNNIVLEIYHNVENKINYDGSMNLVINRIVSFEDMNFYKFKY